jgi:hypothetical protein
MFRMGKGLRTHRVGLLGGNLHGLPLANILRFVISIMKESEGKLITPAQRTEVYPHFLST